VGYARRKIVSHLPERDERPNLSSSSGFFWFVAKGNLLKGPYSTHELKGLVESSEIPSKYYAWRDGFKEWRPIYGIHELASDSFKEPENLSYPLSPLPGAKNSALPTSQPVSDKAPLYKVRFSTSRFAQLDKKEIFGAFLFTLIFSLILVFYSFQSFENEWQRYWGKKVSGSLLQMGKQEEALPLDLIQPLLTAPGLQYQEEHWVPVQMEESIVANPDFIRQMKIESDLPLKDYVQGLSWDKTHTFIRRVKVEGLINLKDTRKIYIEQRGLPFEPLLSNRRL
jgi:hypothetical protein